MEITNTIPKEYEDNDAYMNIIRRVSVRRYSDKPVSSEQVSAILHAAMSAPTGVNKQPWEFVVIDDPELLKQLADALPYAKRRHKPRLPLSSAAIRTGFLKGLMLYYGSKTCLLHQKTFFSRHMPSVSEEYGPASILTRKEWLRLSQSFICQIIWFPSISFQSGIP